MPVPAEKRADNLTVIILAAGLSSRMGGKKKEFLKLNDNLTVLGSSVNTFLSFPEIQSIIIVVSAGEEAAARDALPAKVFESGKNIEFVTGGNSRRASVFNALSFLERHIEDTCCLKDACHLKDSCCSNYALIHDGARPWVSASLVANIITAVKKYGAVIPLLTLTDTPKECDAQINIEASDESKPVLIKTHLKRAYTGIAQTPQAFKFPDILYAHQKAAQTKFAQTPFAQIDEDFTDDAEVWGKFCGQVAVIKGEQENKKITFPEDLK